MMKLCLMTLNESTEEKDRIEGDFVMVKFMKIALEIFYFANSCVRQ